MRYLGRFRSIRHSDRPLNRNNHPVRLRRRPKYHVSAMHKTRNTTTMAENGSWRNANATTLTNRPAIVLPISTRRHFSPSSDHQPKFDRLRLVLERRWKRRSHPQAAHHDRWVLAKNPRRPGRLTKPA